MAKNSALAKEILRITEGLIANLTDLSLFLIYFGIGFGTTLGGKKEATNKGLGFASETLAKINYRSLKRAVWDLKRKGLIKNLKMELITADKITKEGQQRLNNFLPVYNHKRTWDGRLYLISYDIPSKPAGKRDAFREFLKKLKCAPLQHSVWLTCYNPKKLIKTFIEEQKIPGQILISDLGPDGSIGEKDIKSLLEEVYNLADLNYDYQEFIKRFQKMNHQDKNNQLSANFSFLSILQNDPQLPWPLLPDDWLGEKAYHLYNKFAMAKNS
jgi:DNA-binding transcriptional regulator PaaX